jgi:hypothetical protein
VNLNDKIVEIEEAGNELSRLIGEAIREAQEEAEDLVYGPDADLEGTAGTMVDLLEIIKGIKSNVRDADNEANPTLVQIMDNMGTKKFQRGILNVERKVSSYRTNWQNDVLIRSVANTALDEIEERQYVDQESGQFVSERAIVGPWLDAVVDRLLECAAFRDWRVTALRHHIPGLDPDNFCDVKRSVKAVVSVGKGR